MTTSAPDTYAAKIPSLDLRLRCFERTVNGIHVIGTWLLDEDARRPPEPCLVLLDPRRPIDAGRTVPVVIRLQDYADWAPNTADADKCRRLIRSWLDAGYLPGSPSSVRDVMRVRMAVEDSLRDLLHIPPRIRPRSSFGIGEATIRDEDGNVLGEKVVTL